MTKLLIVDDEKDNIELLSRRLIRRGFTIVSAVNAKDGLAMAIVEQPNLILMDIKMPDIDGLEATKMLKADERTRSIPVIALTAHAMKEDRDRAVAAGAADYETKPVDLERLLGKITLLANPT